MIELMHWNFFVEKVIMPDQQMLLLGTGSCKSMVAEKESTQAQYEEAACELSDAYDEDFDLKLQYMSVAIPNDALPK